MRAYKSPFCMTLKPALGQISVPRIPRAQLRTHTLDVIHILIIPSNESNTKEITNINRHGSQPLATSKAGKVILEDISGSIVSLSAMPCDKNQNHLALKKRGGYNDKKAIPITPAKELSITKKSRSLGSKSCIFQVPWTFGPTVVRK